MNENELLAELLLPKIDKTPEYYENLYPARELPEEAKVTRVAPSPTGYLHLGTLFTALVNRMTASASGGIFYTRIEDTDKKREVEGGIADIIGGLNRFGIEIDEGFVNGERQEGNYGPYKQSDRAEIYQCYAKDLIKRGLAYPCFCTAEELAEMREKQETLKVRTGYHGEWAKCRDLSYEQIKALIEAGKPFVVRLRSGGDENRRIVFDDVIKGRIEMPENDEDFVILKSDGIPTYHFAHAVDDHLMRTTHVFRGDEWISSAPKHIELFKVLGFKPVKYGHISPIMKLDGGAKRKISKRKDPEAAVHFFAEEGYPAGAVIEYLMTVAASDFEDWRKANPNEDYRKFKFNPKKMSISGALFDSNKLNDVSKIFISKITSEEVYNHLLDWASEFDKDFYGLLTQNPEYSKKMLAVDRDGVKNARKDIARWNEAKEYFAYYFDRLFVPCYETDGKVSQDDAEKFLTEFMHIYNTDDDRTVWFDKIKQIAPSVGFAAETKEYKSAPEKFKGSAGDLSGILRLAVTGRRNTPDLCGIMSVIGKDNCEKRIKEYIKNI